MSGFYIKEIKVTGDGKKDAQIILNKGLNVIHGPSNTGKSFVFQCIDYIFGAKKLKQIPESQGYTKIYMEIRDFDNDTPITILRILNTNDIFYYSCNIEEASMSLSGKKLKSKHDPGSDDNISKFLLKQIGIDENKFLVKNKDGKKVTLGFRALAHLSIISETDIIAENKSPVLEIQSTQQTYSKSAFRYLLTQEDDFSVTEVEKTEIRKAKNEAKIEYINSELITLEEERERLKDSKSELAHEGISDLDFYKKRIEEIENKIKSKRKELHEINVNNNKLNLQKNKTQIMLEKFQLLKQQYISDIERLDFLIEGNSVLSQIDNTYHCPLCESRLTKDIEEINKDELSEYCNIERIRIQANLKELEESICDLIDELQKLDEMLIEGEKKSKEYNDEITEMSIKDLQPLRIAINLLVEQAKIDNRILDIENIISRKQKEIIIFEESKNVKEEPLTEGLVIDNKIYDELCDKIKESLISCGYSNLGSISYDVKTQDIEINGVPRLSNGKGYRAFFYAIFSASLLLYLQSKGNPFNRILILDSPLTTLKESEMKTVKEDDFIDATLQDGFFAFLAKSFKNNQAIVIENKKPPQTLKGNYNDIEFTKDINRGRYGFFDITDD